MRYDIRFLPDVEEDMSLPDIDGTRIRLPDSVKNSCACSTLAWQGSSGIRSFQPRSIMKFAGVCSGDSRMPFISGCKATRRLCSGCFIVHGTPERFNRPCLSEKSPRPENTYGNRCCRRNQCNPSPVVSLARLILL